MSITRGSFGLNIDPSAKDVKVAFELAQLADTTGFGFVGVQDHLYHPQFLDAWTFLTALASATKNVTVMSNVATTALRPPALLIKAASTLSLLSDGRVALGVGAGAMSEGIAAYGGAQRTTPETVAAFEEAMNVMRMLRDPEVRSARVSGEYYQLRGAHPGPLPGQPVPILVGSYGPRMLEITGRLGDGWLPTSAYAPPSVAGQMNLAIDKAAEDAQRDPREIVRIYNVMGSITDDNGAGRDDTQARVIGSAQYWIDSLASFRDDLGFDSFLFWPVEADPLEQATRFAQEVLPAFATVANKGDSLTNGRK